MYFKPVFHFFGVSGRRLPLRASILSLIVACVAPLQSALERIAPVKGALGAAGNCSIPLTLVVLGAYFYSEPQEEDLQNEDLSYSQIGKRQCLEHQTSRSSLLSISQEMFGLRRASQCGDKSRSESKDDLFDATLLDVNYSYLYYATLIEITGPSYKPLPSGSSDLRSHLIRCKS